MRMANQQEVFDHLFGSGCVGEYTWYHRYEPPAGESKDGKVPAGWSAKITMINGNDRPVTKEISYETVMSRARRIVREYLMEDPAHPEHNTRYGYGDILVQECAKLIFDPDAVDFDADSADQFLQLLVLGEVVFG